MSVNQEHDAVEMWSEDEFHFQGQRPDEHVMLVRNQHWATLFRPSLYIVVSLVLPYLFVKFLTGSVLGYALALYGLFFLFYVSRMIYAYRHGMMILTNHRLMLVIQRGFLSRAINEAELNRIQDVSSEIKGALPTLFGFGDVTIRTASKDSLLLIKHVADPYEVQQTIVRTLKEVQG